MSNFFDFTVTWDLLRRDFVIQAMLALALLGLLGGILSPLIVTRQMSFAIHGISELTVTGAAAALLAEVSINFGATVGAIVAAITFGVLGKRTCERDSVIGVVMAFGLGLGILFLAMYGRGAQAGFALLTGQVVSVGSEGIVAISVTTAIVLAILLVIYRPLLFASVDPQVALSNRVPTKTLSVVFALIIGLACAQTVQVIGALLVMSLIITPGAAAMRISSNPTVVTIVSIVFAEIAAIGGLILSLAPKLPVSVFVTTISFMIYITCRRLGRSLSLDRRDHSSSNRSIIIGTLPNPIMRLSSHYDRPDP